MIIPIIYWLLSMCQDIGLHDLYMFYLNLELWVNEFNDQLYHVFVNSV